MKKKEGPLYLDKLNELRRFIADFEQGNAVGKTFTFRHDDSAGWLDMERYTISISINVKQCQLDATATIEFRD